MLFELLLLSQVQKKKQREELSSEEGVAAARLSLRLVTIQTNLNLPPVRCAPQLA